MSAPTLEAQAEAPHCAQHPAKKALGACSRCGTFGCWLCLDKRRSWLCLACAEREPDLIGSDPPLRYGFAFREALRLAFKCARVILVGGVFLDVAVAASRGVLGLLLPREAAGFLSNVIAQTLVVLFSTVVLLAAADVRLKRARPTAELVGEALQRFPAALAAALWSGVAIGLGLMALVLPGLWLASKYAVAVPVAVLDPSNRRPLRRSSSLTEGYRGASFSLFATGWGLVALSLDVLISVVELAKQHQLSPLWILAGLVAQGFALALAPLMTLTTYTGLLALEALPGHDEFKEHHK